MATNKKQTKADKAFIEKISTLNIGGSSKAGGVPTCEDCGHELQVLEAHVIGVAAGGPGRRQRKATAPSTDEVAFSA